MGIRNHIRTGVVALSLMGASAGLAPTGYMLLDEQSEEAKRVHEIDRELYTPIRPEYVTGSSLESIRRLREERDILIEDERIREELIRYYMAFVVMPYGLLITSLSLAAGSVYAVKPYNPASDE